MSDLRAMVALANGNGEPEAKPEPAKPETVEAEKPETVTETVETKQEPEDKDEPLPEGVVKRIAKEAEKAARIQSEIDKAVSTRKAKEAELAAIASKTGSEPAPNTAQANGEPKEPTWAEYNAQGKSWGEFEEALAKSKTEYRDWLKAETDRMVEQKLTERQQKQAVQARWDEAVKTHGKEFPALMEQAQAIAPEGLQQAISALDNWSAVAVHLAKHPAQLKELSAAYDANSIKAIATLGRIEASLKTAPKTEAPAKPLPDPIAVVGGTASASASDFDIEKASMASLRAYTNKIRGR